MIDCSDTPDLNDLTLEMAGLQGRVHCLMKFKNGEKYDALPASGKMDLILQLEYMQGYLRMLNKRIDALGT
jgi:hypothetical protein